MPAEPKATVTDISDLQHDIARHVAICSEHATRIIELEAALREIAEVAEAGFADVKSPCRTEAKAIAHAARQALK